MRATKPSKNYLAALRDHAVRRVRKQLERHGSEWAAISAIRSEIGCDAATIIGQFKADVIPRFGLWKSGEDAACAAFDWVDRLNNRRLLELIGYFSLIEAENRYRQAR